MMAHTAFASDPDLTTDFNVTDANVSNFTFTGFRNLQPGGQGIATGTPVSFLNLPGLNGLGLTALLFEFGPQSQIDPHTHPRTTEVFYVTSGKWTWDLWTRPSSCSRQSCNLFVFPKGMLHWQRNSGSGTASRFSALSSENLGTLSIAKALFTCGNKGLPDIVLATAFNTDQWEVDSLKNSVASRNDITLGNLL